MRRVRPKLGNIDEIEFTPDPPLGDIESIDWEAECEKHPDDHIFDPEVE